jgi:hypothetical protein
MYCRVPVAQQTVIIDTSAAGVSVHDINIGSCFGLNVSKVAWRPMPAQRRNNGCVFSRHATVPARWGHITPRVHNPSAPAPKNCWTISKTSASVWGFKHNFFRFRIDIHLFYIYLFKDRRVLFPALPDFLRSSGSGTGSTQPREYNWGATW